MTEWGDILIHIKDWVQKAGEEQTTRFEQPMKMKAKTSDIDLVTEVDVWTEKFLIDHIQSTYPTHAILTEESGHYAGDAGYEWVLYCQNGKRKLADWRAFKAQAIA